jgi:hypothetical protein
VARRCNDGRGDGAAAIRTRQVPRLASAETQAFGFSFALNFPRRTLSLAAFQAELINVGLNARKARDPCGLAEACRRVPQLT